MQNPVQEIKDRVSVVDIVGAYVALTPAGKSFKGRCPFHNEKTPSFFVTPERGSYYCFGCGAKGDIFTFVQEFEGVDFMGALKILADRAGITLRQENKEVREGRDRLYYIMEEAARYYERCLTETPAAKSYIKSRGLTDETVKHFRIGYAPDETIGWRNVTEYLKKKGFKEEEILAVGLSKRPESTNGGKSPYDRFRGRIMFPIADSSGRIIAFTGRVIVDKEGAPKYLNSPDTELFDKSTVLYALDKAKFAIRKVGYSILVEGQMDAIVSHQAGFTNTIALSGTALADSVAKEGVISSLGIVKRISSNMIIALDADDAGMKAALRSASIALSLGMEVKIAAVTGGKDPADAILSSKESWKTILRESKPIVEFALDAVLKEKLDDRRLSSALTERVLPYLKLTSNPLERDRLIHLISDKTGRSDRSIIEALAMIPDKEIATPVQIASVKKEEKNPLYRRVALALASINQGKLPGKTKEYIIQELTAKTNEQHVKDALAPYLENLKEFEFEAEVMYADPGFLASDIKELMQRFEDEYLRALLLLKLREIKNAEALGDPPKVKALLKEYQDLSRRLTTLR